jgi:hypothetical protein
LIHPTSNLEKKLLKDRLNVINGKNKHNNINMSRKALKLKTKKSSEIILNILKILVTPLPTSIQIL